MPLPTILQRCRRALQAFVSHEEELPGPVRSLPLTPFWISASQWISRAVYVVVKLDIIERLQRDPMTLETIADKANCRPVPLGRIMHALARCGLFRIDQKQRFHLTAASKTLCADANDSLRHWTLLLGESWWHAAGGMLECVQSGDSGFEAVFGETMWQYYSHHSGDRDVFDRAMNEVTVWQSLVIAEAVDIRDKQRLVDIGAGSGALISALLARNPSATGVAFDRTETQPTLLRTLEKRGLGSRCEAVAGDFFCGDELPNHGDAYFIKHVLHDWSDGDVIRILTACRSAMPDSAQLFIVEGLRGRDLQTDFLLDWLDIEQMVVTSGGRERSQKDFARILAESGFTLQQVQHTQVADVSILKAVKS